MTTLLQLFPRFDLRPLKTKRCLLATPRHSCCMSVGCELLRETFQIVFLNFKVLNSVINKKIHKNVRKVKKNKQTYFVKTCKSPENHLIFWPRHVRNRWYIAWNSMETDENERQLCEKSHTFSALQYCLSYVPTTWWNHLPMITEMLSSAASHSCFLLTLPWPGADPGPADWMGLLWCVMFATFLRCLACDQLAFGED